MSSDRDTLIFEGKTYVSAQRAARNFGFVRDYVARLARQGKVRGRQVGRAWYVEVDSFRAYVKVLGEPGSAYAHVEQSGGKTSAASERVETMSNSTRIAHAVYTRKCHTMQEWVHARSHSRSVKRAPALHPVLLNAAILAVTALVVLTAPMFFDIARNIHMTGSIMSQTALASSGISFFDDAALSVYRTVCPFVSNCEEKIVPAQMAFKADPRLHVADTLPKKSEQEQGAEFSPPPSAKPAPPAASVSPAAGVSIIERIVETVRVVGEQGITRTEFDAGLGALEASFASRLADVRSSASSQTTAVYNVVGEMGRIEHLSDVTLENPTITGALTLSSPLSLTSGGTGTSTAPTYGQLLLGNNDGTYDLVATSSLGITSGASLSGGTAGLLAAWDSATSIVATSSPTAGYFTATSSTASIFPYASTTALTVSGTGFFGVASTTDLFVNSWATSTSLAIIGITDSLLSTNSLGQVVATTSINASNLALTEGYVFRGESGSAEATSTLFIADSGYVGIGTTGPSGKLTVSDTDGGDKELLSLVAGYDTGSQKALTWRDANNIVGQIDTRYDGTGVDMVFGHLYNSGYQTSDLMTIKASGNIGIGTTTPGAVLHTTVTGTGDVFKLTRESTGAYFTTDFTGSLTNFDSFDDYRFSIGGTELMTIDKATGNIGIGTTSPSDELHIEGSDAGGHVALNIVNTSDTANSRATLRLRGLNGSNGIEFQSYLDDGLVIRAGGSEFGRIVGTRMSIGDGDGSPDASLDISQNGSDDLFMASSGIGGDGDYFIIKNGGNVGVGTTDPLSSLDISVSDTSITGDGTQGQIRLRNTDATVGSVAALLFQTHEGSDNRRATIHAGYDTTVGDTRAGYIGFTTRGSGGSFAEAMRIAGSGNVGIGTTTPGSKLDVSGFINTDQYSGYKQAGNTVLYASSTNLSAAVAAPSAAAWMSATSSVFQSVAIGSEAMAAAPTTGTAIANVAVGWRALRANTAGIGNVALGRDALYNNTGGNYNVASGYTTLVANTSGSGNVANGAFALDRNTTGSNNVGVGYQALYGNASATNTVAVGANAANGNYTAYANQGGTIVGTGAGFNFQTGSDYNTLLGYRSGYDITTGSNNTILGQFTATGVGITTGDNNILIGQGVRAGLSRTGSNQLNIGNLIFGTGLGSNATLATGNVGIGTTGPTSLLHVSKAVVSGDVAITLQNDTSSALSTSLNFVNSGDEAYTGVAIQALRTNSPAAADNDLLFYTRGNSTLGERVRITSTGNVGIGTTSPESLLHVQAAISNPAVFTLEGSETTANTPYSRIDFANSPHDESRYTGARIVSRNDSAFQDGNLEFYVTTNGTSNLTEAVRITSVGNVGIGTTTPEANLHISSPQQATLTLEATDIGTAPAFTTAINLIGYENRANGIFMTDEDTTHEWFTGSPYFNGGYSIGYTDTTTSQSEYPENSKLFISTSGNVGIGTTSPEQKLLISGETHPAIKLESNSDSTYNTVISNHYDIDNTFRLTNNNTEFFNYRRDTNAVWFNAGNVGIGTTSPTSKLQITGDTTDSHGQLYITGATDPTRQLRIGYDTTNNYGFIRPIDVGDSESNLILNQYGGNVGIGTTSPEAKLQVADGDLVIGYPKNATARGLTIYSADTSSARSASLKYDGASTLYLSGGTANQTLNLGRNYGSTDSVFSEMNFDINSNFSPSSFNFLIGNETQFTIQEGGNVGIGTTSPQTNLHVSSANTAASFGGLDAEVVVEGVAPQLAIVGGSGNTGFLTFGDEVAYAAGRIEYDHLSDNLSFWTSGQEEVTIVSSGNVGIGTTSPQELLHLYDTATSTLSVQSTDQRMSAILRAWSSYDGATSDNGDALIQLGGKNSGINTPDNAWYIGLDGSTGADNFSPSLTFGFNAGGWGVPGDGDLMTIADTGNVGIGTANPGAKLHVETTGLTGNVGMFYSSGVTDNPTLQLGNGAGALRLFAAGGTSAYMTGTTQGDVGLLYDTGDDFFIGQQDEVPGISILDSGNVGIGTTTPRSSLSVVSGSGTDGAFPGGSWAAEVYNTTDNSTEHGLVVANRWQNNVSQAFTVGNLYDNGDGFDTWFTVKGGGNVGIGTTTPAARLTVVGLSQTSSGVSPLCYNTSTGAFSYDDATSCTASSARFKHDITSLSATSSLAEIMRLRPVSFVFNADIYPNDQSTHVGFIAEEVHEVDPRITAYEADDVTPRGVKYSNITALLAGAIQAQQWQLDTLIGSTTPAEGEEGSFVSRFFANLYERLVAWFANAANGIGDFFAKDVYAENAFVETVTAKTLCLEDVCVTKEQLQALLAGVANAATSGDGQTPSIPPNEAPTLIIIGNNPERIPVGTPYTDPDGASYTDDKDELLSILTFVNNLSDESPREHVLSVSLDTSTTTTYEITYRVVDSDDNATEATRIVEIYLPAEDSTQTGDPNAGTQNNGSTVPVATSTPTHTGATSAASMNTQPPAKQPETASKPDPQLQQKQEPEPPAEGPQPQDVQ